MIWDFLLYDCFEIIYFDLITTPLIGSTAVAESLLLTLNNSYKE